MAELSLDPLLLERIKSLQEEIEDLKEELKAATIAGTILHYEKYWILGEDGTVEPDLDQVHQDFKDGNIKDEETYKYLLEHWGWEETSDEEGSLASSDEEFIGPERDEDYYIRVGACHPLIRVETLNGKVNPHWTFDTSATLPPAALIKN